MRTSVVVLMAAFLMSSAMPALAQTAQEEETCAISAGTCLDKVVILEKRIKKLKAEIKSGKVKTSEEEMKMLEKKLQDAIDQLNKIEGKK